MRIAFACDHGGFAVKEKIIAHLKERGYEVLDFGTYSAESCNYPEFAIRAAEAVADKRAEKGILVCSSGEGVVIAANKVKGVIAGLGYDDTVSRLIVEHNHANMISFGALYMSEEDILRRIDIFLDAKPLPGRHQRRVDMILAREN